MQNNNLSINRQIKTFEILLEYIYGHFVLIKSCRIFYQKTLIFQFLNLQKYMYIYICNFYVHLNKTRLYFI